MSLLTAWSIYVAVIMRLMIYLSVNVLLCEYCFIILFRFVIRREHRVNSRKKGLVSPPPDPRVRIRDWSPRITRSHHRTVSILQTTGTTLRDNDKMAITWRDKQVVWARSTHSMKGPATVTEHIKTHTYRHNLTKQTHAISLHFTVFFNLTSDTLLLLMYILSFNFFSLTMFQTCFKISCKFWQNKHTNTKKLFLLFDWIIISGQYKNVSMYFALA